MTIHYCPVTRGFYDSSVHGNVPENAIPLSEKTYAALLEGESRGAAIEPPDAEHDGPWLREPEPPTLEHVRLSALEALRNRRKSVEYGGFDLDGEHWDSAEKDELRLNSVTKLFEGGLPQYDGWKIAEGRYITLTPELAGRAALALMQHYGNTFAVEAAKAAEIAALDTPEAVAAWLRTELESGW